MEEFELEPGEKITMSVRRHWFVLVASLIPFAVLAWLPTILPALFQLAARGASSEASQQVVSWVSVSNPWIRFGLGAWWLILWMAAFTVITKYFLTIWVITNTRIVDMKQQALFNRKVSSTLLARVQDVTTSVNGFFSTIVGFGTLKVQTAGAEEELTMTSIASPERLRDLIMREVADLHAGTHAEL